MSTWAGDASTQRAGLFAESSRSVSRLRLLREGGEGQLVVTVDASHDERDDFVSRETFETAERALELRRG
jgi:hypothetical protein